MTACKWLRYFRILAAMLLLAGAVTSGVSAQTGNGSIHGVIVDQTGGAVPNASVVVVSASGQMTSATAVRVNHL